MWPYRRKEREIKGKRNLRWLCAVVIVGIRRKPWIIRTSSGLEWLAICICFLLSIELIISEYQEIIPSCIYVYGKGLDDLVDKNVSLPSRFKRLSEMNLIDYSYVPKSMAIHESESKSIEGTIETLSLITSCL